MANIIEGIHEQCDRVRKIIAIYDTVPMGHIAATMMRESIKQAEDAISSGDTIKMISTFKNLQQWEDC
jgi:hypothetical protein